MDDRTEARRAAYEETPPHRTDRTHGTFAIWRSPFNSPEQICEAMTRRDGVQWLVWTTHHVGGQTGAWKYAVKATEDDAKPLARDSHNRWYIAIDDGRRWGMLDIERTEALADFAEFAGRCEIYAATIATHEQKELPTKPSKLCVAHADYVLDHSGECTRCATDKALMERWEINIGQRCAVCRKLNRYCECE